MLSWSPAGRACNKKKECVEILATKIFTNIFNISIATLLYIIYILLDLSDKSLSSNLTWFIVNILSFLSHRPFMIFFAIFSPRFLRHRKIIFSIIFSIVTFRFRDLQTNLDLDSKTIPTTKLSIGVFSVREYWKFIDHDGGETDIASSKKKKRKKMF